MPAEICVDVRASPEFESYAALVEEAGCRSLEFLRAGSCELSICLVDDSEIRQLNANWRDKNRPTDVLAFAQQEGELVPGSLLGDVVISVPTASRQAAEEGHSVEREILELLAHGILHLLGYDHERSEAEAQRMFSRQRQVVERLLVSVGSIGNKG